MASLSPEEKLDIKKKTHRQLMWVGILSIIMIFAGLSSAYIVAKADSTWVKITLPTEFFISSAIIVLSSITFFFAVRFAKADKFNLVTPMVVLTLILGLLFVKYQVQGWDYLRTKGMNLVDASNLKWLINESGAEYGKDYTVVVRGNELKYEGGQFYDKRDVANTLPVSVQLETKNSSSSYLYLLTGLHVVHLFAGLISLIVVTIKSLRRKYNKNDIIGLQVSSIYWHFLDFLWLYLLALLYFLS